MSSRPVTQAPAPSPNVNPITHPCVKSLSPADDCVVHPGVESSQPSFSEAEVERKSEEDAKVVDSIVSSEFLSSGVNEKVNLKEEAETTDETSDINTRDLSSADLRRRSSSYTMSSGTQFSDADLNELSHSEQVPAPSSDRNLASTPSSLANALYSGDQSSQISSSAANNDVSRKEEVAAITGTSDTTPPASEEQSTGAASAHSDHTNAADSGTSSTTPRARAPRRRSKTLSRGTIDPTALLDAPPAPITEITAEPGDVAETLTDNEKAVENKENDPSQAH
ncbi:hypothetical protein C2E23DRAFT_891076 [Lenzites betulinus]|nr:hypothetical protein C2E23DRAFT_891076 [Lenzites betulinus]